jgi:hypothetical protein
MEYMPGTILEDCYEKFNEEQARRTGEDIARIMFSLFRITADACGCIMPMSTAESAQPSSPYTISVSGSPLSSVPADRLGMPSSRLTIGPVNDIAFLDYPAQLPSEICGPFKSERDWMEAFAFLGSPRTRTAGETGLELDPMEKTMDIYEVVSDLYWSHSKPGDKGRFHLAHGDLSHWNILVNPESGSVTGILDWEMAGFRPAWLAAVGGAWLDDDSQKFIMVDHQSGRRNYAKYSAVDIVNQERFRAQLGEFDPELLHHHSQGTELRAFFYACCNTFSSNTSMWMKKYAEIEWPLMNRGPFPFDFESWLNDRITIETR